MKRSHFAPGPDRPIERALLVGVTLAKVRREDEIDNIRELELLARTAGAEVLGYTIQNRTRLDGSTFIGKGKLEELARTIWERGANLVIFDDDLTPAQARNIEEQLDVNVIDRTELILDIFARRARTKQAKIQVEIAQLNYALPRLRRLWEHLSRLGGGIGTRGPGETQLEVDRRRARDRMAHLEQELERLSRGVIERRKKRGDIYNVTIVGYTNAGKSTLLNRISGSSVVISDRLFSTLDSTTRRVERPGAAPFLLTDTIGFIRKLPTHLVASFKATLLDVRETDLLVHVVDAAHPRADDHIEVVNSVLRDVLRPAGQRAPQPPPPTILVLNKIDLVEDEAARRRLAARHPEAVLASAATGDGVEELLRLVEERRAAGLVEAEVSIPAGDGAAIDAVERIAEVLERRPVGERMRYRVRVRPERLAALERAGAVKVRPGGRH